LNYSPIDTSLYYFVVPCAPSTLHCTILWFLVPPQP